MLPVKNRLPRIVLEVQVRNHPGVMSHICGLFSRRGFNLEGILCLPLDGSQSSRIWLLVNPDERLEQIIKQLEKLLDVESVRQQGAGHEDFLRLEEIFKPAPRATSPVSNEQSIKSGDGGRK